MSKNSHYLPYQSIYGDGQVWVRSREEFFSEVERYGYKGPRFTETTNNNNGQAK